MNIHASLFAYGLADDLLHAFQSINQPDLTVHLFLHSRVREVIKACETIAMHPNVHFYPYGVNRGCAVSNNEALMAALYAGADAFLDWSDDVTAHPGDVDRIARAVVEHPECSYVESMGYVERTGRTEALGMVGAGINLRCVEKIGYFDQNLVPVYFDDTDWERRANLAGMHKCTVEGTYLTHGGSKSETDVTEDALQRYFYPNRDYYINKWGGDKGHETFTVPFNDPKYDLMIKREHVGNPYPDHRKA